MRRYVFREAFGTLGLTAGLVFAEPAVRVQQQASADSWQQYWGTEGITCEGCCGVGFCCSVSSRCKVIIH